MARKKSKKKRTGRPRTRGETVSVTLRLSKELSDRIDQVRARVEKTRTEIIEGLLKAGFSVDLPDRRI